MLKGVKNTERRMKRKCGERGDTKTNESHNNIKTSVSEHHKNDIHRISGRIPDFLSFTFVIFLVYKCPEISEIHYQGEKKERKNIAMKNILWVEMF